MIELINISHTFLQTNKRHSVTVFKDFSLSIQKKEFISLLGPSGSGKTTLVNILAGYVQPEDGVVRIDGKTQKKPGRNRIVMNQENDLFDWMTVEENIKLVNQDSEVVDSYLKMVHLEAQRDSYPRELSGGMKKRLSLARALSTQPDFLILDEPFASLDVESKNRLHEELLQIVETSGCTILLVTHDVDEAVFLSDRVVILKGKGGVSSKEVHIPFDRPRTMSLKDSEVFKKTKKEINSLIAT